MKTTRRLLAVALLVMLGTTLVRAQQTMHSNFVRLTEETRKDVDMGGTFDWFGPESHPDFCGNPETGKYTGDNHKSPKRRSITPEQFRNRMILRKAMLRHGFKPISTEWWHFTLKNEPYPKTFFTFPVRE